MLIILNLSNTLKLLASTNTVEADLKITLGVNVLPLLNALALDEFINSNDRFVRKGYKISLSESTSN